MRKLRKTKKNRLLVFLCCAVLTAGLLTGCGDAGGSGTPGGSGGTDAENNPGKASETARTIVVQETNGTTIVLDEAKVSTNAYKGMHLFSGNDVTVQEISDLTMLLDMDKYLYAEESTHFWLEATGTQENSQTTIYLEEGAELNRIVNPLEEGSVYQVHTPNSTMAVRGTVFRMEVRKGKDNKVYTDLAVLDGSVEVKLKTTEGEYNGVEETIEAGQAAAIRADSEISEFITDENGSITTPVDYTTFPSGTVEKIIEYIDDGEEIAADKEELEKVAEDLKAQEEEQRKEKQEEEQKEEEHEHEWQTVTVRQADCTKEGLSQAVCSVCGETGEQQAIPVAAHKASANWTIEKEATCTEEGTQVKTCTVCGEVLESRQVSKSSHKPGEEQTIDATCTEPGSVSVVCLLCGHTIEEHLLEALGHQPGSWVVIQPANYGVEGSQSQFCTVCGQLLGTQSIPALIPEPVPEPEACKHEVEEWEVISATCTTAGSRTGTCSLCKEEVTEITIAALGHAPAKDWTITKNPTCTETGTHVKYCTRCEVIVASEEVGALGHELTAVEAQAPTCTTAGHNAYWTCSTCGANFSDQNGENAIANLEIWMADDGVGGGKIAATGHSFSDVWSYDADNHWHAATCEHTTEKKDQAGHSGGTATCTAQAVCTTCNQPYGELDAHTLLDRTDAVAPTCTGTGVKAYWTCSKCHANFADAEGRNAIADLERWKADGSETGGKINATGHSFSHDWSYDANNHWHAATCEHTTEKKDQAGHSGGTATCIYKAVCSTCNQAYGNLASHKLIQVNAQAATCTEDGVQAYWTCSVCHANFSDAGGNNAIDLENWKIGTGKIEALGHEWSEWSVLEDCTKGGTQNRRCTRAGCAETDSLNINAQEKHVWEWIETTAPTCTVYGVKTQCCKNCAKTFATETVSPRHTPGNWYVVKEATCTEDGLRAQDCTKCDSKEIVTEPIPALKHQETWVVDETAEKKIVDKDGNVWEVTANKICERCHIVLETKLRKAVQQVLDTLDKIWQFIEDAISK